MPLHSSAFGGFFSAGLLLSTGDLGPSQSLLNASLIRVDPRGHVTRMPRAVFELGGKTILGQLRSARHRRRKTPTDRAHPSIRRATPCAGSSPDDRPVNAGSPVRISHRIEPRAKTSQRSSSRSTSPRACSGAMYDGVPITLPACDRSRIGPPPLRAVAITVSRVACLARGGVVGHAALRQDLGQAPVHHLHLAERADHDVRRLQVAMDHAAGVGVGDRLADGLRRSRGSAAGRERGSVRSSSRLDSVRPLTSFMAKYGRRSAKAPSS